MDPQTAGIASAMLALFTFISSCVAFYFAWRSSKSAEQSATIAEYSARAAESSATSALRSADAAEHQAVISATEFAANAPFLEAKWVGGGWEVTNLRDAAAYNVTVEVDPPHGYSIRPRTRVATQGKSFRVTPKVPMPNQSLTLSWTRTPDGGPHDKPRRETYKRPMLYGK